MLDDFGYDEPKGMMKAERCKPDYELMIKRERERLNKVDKLLEAIFNYIGTMVSKGKMAELIGELTCMSRRYNASIEDLIEQQEKEGGD